MRILRPEAGREIDRFGSVAASALRLADVADGALTLIRLGPGGVLGRHPGVVPQLFVVVEGAGMVSGADGVAHPIAAGEAAFWEEGEEHETRTDAGLVAIVLEARSAAAR